MGLRLRRLLAAFTTMRVIALAFLVFIIIAAALAPVMTADPLAQDVANARQPIGSPGHLLGTDAFGRDVLSRLLHGAGVELYIAFGAMVIAFVVGTLIGILGGYFGGYVETLTMRVLIDVLLAFPPVILALLIVTIYGSGTTTLIVTLGVLFSPVFARTAYGQTLSVRRTEYVEAARAYGASVPRILAGTVLPNVSAPLVVQASLVMAGAILLESGLSYLGLGVVPPAPSLGTMVAEGQRYMSNDPQLILIPSALIVLTILSFSLVGDVLRDWLDPRGKQVRGV